MCGQWEEREYTDKGDMQEWCKLEMKSCSCSGELEYCSYPGMLPEGEYEEDR
ncbi:hypothetical protein CCP1ISM_50044 [Azospirillaceae bacterium]